MRRTACVWLLVPVCMCSLAQTLRFTRHPIATLEADSIAGAALPDDSALFTWGAELIRWRVPDGGKATLARGPFGEGGCLTDVDRDGTPDVVVQEGGGAARLVWLRASDWSRHEIDSGVETHDVLPAALHGRRGVLLVHRYGQVRFYEIPGNPVERWPYREIYSFYTPSRQGGLLLDDVDGDGRSDILCGNYWIRSPARFDLPWRLFAINTYSEAALSGMARLALAGLLGQGTRQLVVAEGEIRKARLAWFQKPADPTGLWIEHRVDAGLDLDAPHGLATGDFDGDGRIDIAVGEKEGARPRLIVFRNEGGGRFRAIEAGDGPAIHTLRALDLNGDGRLDLLAIGPESVAWWENRAQRRK